MSVTLLEAQFRVGDLAERIGDCLAREALPGTTLELEVTESILLRTDTQPLETLQKLRALGVSITFRNYGTDRAALDLLKRIPLSRLKIDPSFVKGMLESKVDAAILRVILYLANSLELSVTAQGVETAEQVERLRRKGCEEAQGLWFGDAMPLDVFASREQR